MYVRKFGGSFGEFLGRTRAKICVANPCQQFDQQLLRKGRFRTFAVYTDVPCTSTDAQFREECLQQRRHPVPEPDWLFRQNFGTGDKGMPT